MRKMAGCQAQEFPSLFLTMLSTQAVLPCCILLWPFAAGKKHLLKNSIFPHYCILIKMELTGQQFIHAQTRAKSYKLAFRNPQINCYCLGGLPWRAEVGEFHLGEVEELKRYGIQQSSCLHCITLINRIKNIHSRNGIFCVFNYFKMRLNSDEA